MLKNPKLQPKDILKKNNYKVHHWTTTNHNSISHNMNKCNFFIWLIETIRISSYNESRTKFKALATNLKLFSTKCNQYKKRTKKRANTSNSTWALSFKEPISARDWSISTSTTRKSITQDFTQERENKSNNRKSWN